MIFQQDHLHYSRWRIFSGAGSVIQHKIVETSVVQNGDYKLIVRSISVQIRRSYPRGALHQAITCTARVNHPVTIFRKYTVRWSHRLSDILLLWYRWRTYGIWIAVCRRANPFTPFEVSTPTRPSKWITTSQRVGPWHLRISHVVDGTFITRKPIKVVKENTVNGVSMYINTDIS